MQQQTTCMIEIMNTTLYRFNMCKAKIHVCTVYARQCLMQVYTCALAMHVDVINLSCTCTLCYK